MELNDKLKYELSDEMLCKQAALGDRVAEEQLVSRYMRLARACTRPYFLAGGDSEDLLQEAMIGLLNAIREFNIDHEVAFCAFAEVCIRNRIRSAVTAAAREKHAPLNNSISIEQQPVEERFDCDPEEVFISQESEAERLAAINQKLSSFEKRILTLYLNGYSYHEIGVQLNRADKSVDNAIQRIRRKVANYLGDFSEG